MRKVALLLLTLLTCTLVQAQEDPEYRAEIGGGIGLMGYLGDFNGRLMADQQAMGALQARYKMNPRMAWALTVGLGKLKGASDHAATWYPAITDSAKVAFSHTLADVGARYEYNFWPYGTGREYRGARPLTPYITFGLGATVAKTPTKTVVALNVPMGLGLKYKVAERLNLSAEWLMHFSGSDELDGVKDPYTVRSSGLFKNTDCYTTLQLSLTYDIWAKCKTCNNDRD